ELLKVHVNRMLPASRVVLKNPLLHRILFNPEAWRLVATTDELAVDLPLPVASLKPERAGDARRIVGVRESVEVSRIRRNRRRIDTVVCHGRAVDDDLEDLRSLAGAEHVSSWTTTIFLLETVLEIESFSSLTGEVDDDVDTFGHGKARAGYLYRSLQQVAVCRDLPERLGRVVWSKHKHLVEARGSRVQPAETIAPRAHVQHRIDFVVNNEAVTENSVGIEQIKPEQPGLFVKHLVVKDHVDIETGKRVLSIAEAR